MRQWSFRLKHLECPSLLGGGWGTHMKKNSVNLDVIGSFHAGPAISVSLAPRLTRATLKHPGGTATMEARSTTIKVNPLHPGKSGLMDTQNDGIWKRYLLCFIHGYIEMSIRQNSGWLTSQSLLFCASSIFKNGALVDVSYSTIFLRAWSLEFQNQQGKQTCLGAGY